MKQKRTKYTQINTNKSMHSEMGPMWQNQIQRTVRTAHLSVLMTVPSFSTQYNTEQFDNCVRKPQRKLLDTVFKNISVWELTDPGTSWLSAYLHLRNALTYLLTYLLIHTCPGWVTYTSIVFLYNGFQNQSNDVPILPTLIDWLSKV